MTNSKKSTPAGLCCFRQESPRFYRVLSAILLVIFFAGCGSFKVSVHDMPNEQNAVIETEEKSKSQEEKRKFKQNPMKNPSLTRKNAPPHVYTGGRNVNVFYMPLTDKSISGLSRYGNENAGVAFRERKGKITCAEENFLSVLRPRVSLVTSQSTSSIPQINHRGFEKGKVYADSLRMLAEGRYNLIDKSTFTKMAMILYMNFDVDYVLVPEISGDKISIVSYTLQTQPQDSIKVLEITREEKIGVFLPSGTGCNSYQSIGYTGDFRFVSNRPERKRAFSLKGQRKRFRGIRIRILDIEIFEHEF